MLQCFKFSISSYCEMPVIFFSKICLLRFLIVNSSDLVVSKKAHIRKKKEESNIQFRFRFLAIVLEFKRERNNARRIEVLYYILVDAK